eukprot:TRINITY_DN14822_c0_g1_i1.p1 TRINITY_DN14822_c0_g1~~TRINITY_DN14822_c0_g1_i1.p1  ORF type:complete len:277 (-),score=21.94 TRINITY_DN14822_c0_g1_i1:272-1102(-)
MIAVSFTCWVGSILTGNYSQVDRLWSIIPFVYCWLFALRPLWTPHQFDLRTIVMSALCTLWGLRLTFNFWRKGGYKSGHEDYRWPVLRQQMHPILFQVFNFVFIAFVQNILLYLLVAPTYIAMKVSEGDVPSPFNWKDLVVTFLWFFFFLGEIVSDQQQWNFQTQKYSLLQKRKPLTGEFKNGFKSSGLYKYSRHPNFFCEISIWWCFWLFTLSSTGTYLPNWATVGPLALTFLFHGSTNFTESLTEKKYPNYVAYQNTTSRLIPWFPRTNKIKRG